jgi:hypothetical protein
VPGRFPRSPIAEKLFPQVLEEGILGTEFIFVRRDRD